MPLFETVVPGLKLLRVPFGDSWTGVVLAEGAHRILIDSGALSSDVDDILLPALKAEGLALQDITYLVNTHSHGDHIGGYARIRELAPGITVVASDTDCKNVENPAALAIRTRGTHPDVSPAPQSYLRGVKVNLVLHDGDVLVGTLKLLTTPGHDAGCVCWLHLPSGTAVTGDSLQGNGTPSEGIGFYQDLDLYRHSLRKLAEAGVENLLCGHDYDGIGYSVRGREAVNAALNRCLAYTVRYQSFVDEQLRAGNTVPRNIAAGLVTAHGCGTPSYLFMAVYTVCEHIRQSAVTLSQYLFNMQI